MPFPGSMGVSAAQGVSAALANGEGVGEPNRLAVSLSAATDLDVN